MTIVSISNSSTIQHALIHAQRAGAELTIGPAAPYGTQVTVRLAQRDRLSA